MSEEPEYVVEFEEKRKGKPTGRWIPVARAVYRRKERADERSREVAEELDTETRVVPRPPIWDEWGFRKLTSRMGGTAPATREMKRRGEAGAVAGWAIYKGHIKNLIRIACGQGPDGEFAVEPAYRTTLIRDLAAVGETGLIEQIDGLWRKHPRGIPLSEVLDLQDDWDDSLERRIGRRIPRSPDELTREEIEDSKRLTREMYRVEEEKPPEEKLRELEAMRRELEERMERLKRELEK